MKSRVAEKNSEFLKQQLSKNSNSLVFSRLADTYRKDGDINQAVELCKQGIQKNPEYVTGRIILGRCYVEQENYDNAIEEFLAVCKMDRHNQVAIKILADLYVKQGKLETAGDLYRILMRMDPFDHSYKILSSRFETSGKEDLYEILGIENALISTKPFYKTPETPEKSEYNDAPVESIDSSVESVFSESYESEPAGNSSDPISIVNSDSSQDDDLVQISGTDIDKRMEALFGQEYDKRQSEEVPDVNDIAGNTSQISVQNSDSDSISGGDISDRIDELFDIPSTNSEKSQNLERQFQGTEYGISEKNHSDDQHILPLENLPIVPGSHMINRQTGEYQVTTDITGQENIDIGLSNPYSDSMKSNLSPGYNESENMDAISDEFEETLQYDRSMFSRLNDEPDYEELSMLNQIVTDETLEVIKNENENDSANINEVLSSDEPVQAESQAFTIEPESKFVFDSGSGGKDNISSILNSNVEESDLDFSLDELEEPEFALNDIADDSESIVNTELIGARLDEILIDSDEENVNISDINDTNRRSVIEEDIAVGDFNKMSDCSEQNENCPDEILFGDADKNQQSGNMIDRNFTGKIYEKLSNTENSDVQSGSFVNSEDIENRLDELFPSDKNEVELIDVTDNLQPEYANENEEQPSGSNASESNIFINSESVENRFEKIFGNGNEGEGENENVDLAVFKSDYSDTSDSIQPENELIDTNESDVTQSSDSRGFGNSDLVRDTNDINRTLTGSVETDFVKDEIVEDLTDDFQTPSVGAAVSSFTEQIDEADNVNVEYDSTVVSDMDVLVVDQQDENLTGDDVAEKIQNILDEEDHLDALESKSDDSVFEETLEQLYSDTTDYVVTPAGKDEISLFENLSFAKDENQSDNQDRVEINPDASGDSSMILNMVDRVDFSSDNNGLLIEESHFELNVNTGSDYITDDAENQETIIANKIEDSGFPDQIVESENAHEIISGNDVQERLEEFFGEDILGKVSEKELIPDDDLSEETIIQDFYTVSGENTATATGNEDLDGVDEVEIDQGLIFVDESDSQADANSAEDNKKDDIQTEIQAEDKPIQNFSATAIFDEISEIHEINDMHDAISDKSDIVEDGNITEVSHEVDTRDKPYAIPDHVLTPTLADIYYQQEQYQLAHQIYSRLLEKDPDNDKIRNRLEEIKRVMEQEPSDDIKSHNKNISEMQGITAKSLRMSNNSPDNTEQRPLAGVRIQKRKSTRKKSSRKKN